MEESAVKVEVEEEPADAEQLEVAAILCDLGRLVRAREQRKRRRERARARAASAGGGAVPVIPSWGRRRPRSAPEEEEQPSPARAPSPPAPAPAAAAAASPDTPLAYPESGGDDAPPKEKGSARPRDQWAEEQQHGEAAASLSPPEENARPLKVARREQQDPAPAPAVLDLNEPARSAADEHEQQRQLLMMQAQQARAAAAAAEWYRQQAQLRTALQKAAVSAGARRRRLEILRAKAACPLPSSSRMRRAG